MKKRMGRLNRSLQELCSIEILQLIFNPWQIGNKMVHRITPALLLTLQPQLDLII